jgi:hypothetical protein
MVLSKYAESEFLKHSKFTIVLLVVAILLGNAIYSLYFNINLDKYYYTYLYNCDLSIFKLLKLTEIWAITSKVFLIILLTQFAITHKKNINFRNYVPIKEFDSFVCNAFVFFIYSFLFQFILSVILLVQLFLFEVGPFKINMTLLDYFKNNFSDYVLNVILTFILGYLIRKKVVLMFIVIVLFSFNVKLPFLIGSKNLKVLHAICEEK